MEKEELTRAFELYSVIREIVQLFGEMEIGSGCEVDDEALASYITSNKYIVDFWGVNSKEEKQQKITDDILNGMPVWQFLKVSDWTKKMLERDLANEQEEAYRKLCRKYKCYTCRYMHTHETSFGDISECTYHPEDTSSASSKGRERRPDWKLRREAFHPKTRCKNYSRTIN